MGGSEQRRDLPFLYPFVQEPWATISQGDAIDVKRAVGAARHCFETKWRDTSGLERARLMHHLADLLEASSDKMANLESTDNGASHRTGSNQPVGPPCICFERPKFKDLSTTHGAAGKHGLRQAPGREALERVL